MNLISTTDLCDAFEAQIASRHLQILAPGYLKFGTVRTFSGPIQTIKTFEDNTLVRSTLETQGEGRVLVIDAGGSLRCALVGGNLALLAQNNGWAGIIIYGCVRDTVELDACAIGVRALAVHPVRSSKGGAGVVGVRVEFSGVSFVPGGWVYADEDGVLFAAEKLD